MYARLRPSHIRLEYRPPPTHVQQSRRNSIRKERVDGADILLKPPQGLTIFTCKVRAPYKCCNIPNQTGRTNQSPREIGAKVKMPFSVGIKKEKLCRDGKAKQPLGSICYYLFF